MKALFTSLAIAIVLGGCSGSPSSDTSSTSNQAGNTNQSAQASARIIDNEDLTPGLMGTDADHNGIRDDIDRLIAQKYSATPAMKKAAEQSAIALQKFMEASTKKEALLAVDDIRRSDACVSKVLPESTAANDKIILSMSKELSALTANTRERFVAYWHAAELAGGSVFSEPQEPVCD